MFRAGHAHRQRKADLVADASTDGCRYLSWCSEEMHGTGNIEECFIDRHALDSRGEVVKDRHDVIPELLVAAKVATDEEEIATKLASSPPWHAAADPIASRFIR